MTNNILDFVKAYEKKHGVKPITYVPPVTTTYIYYPPSSIFGKPALGAKNLKNQLVTKS